LAKLHTQLDSRDPRLAQSAARLILAFFRTLRSKVNSPASTPATCPSNHRPPTAHRQLQSNAILTALASPATATTTPTFQPVAPTAPSIFCAPLTDSTPLTPNTPILSNPLPIGPPPITQASRLKYAAAAGIAPALIQSPLLSKAHPALSLPAAPLYNPLGNPLGNSEPRKSAPVIERIY